ncbi:aconitase family protein [Paenibacillus sp. Aloe-11]|uniref:aconitase family protein n=1 Tax=Paenibacillus sp. Aloe-11 TaxID=1050222 RepID=UPI00024F022D|nr:aconitase family protein [Paenibacillus sp. Aloe-11]EHS59226.1 3-isopropylmalate/(R)-2-methylmalate dehydratase large subunit [Paenibacillus sp. Aloe-11]
MAMIEHVLSASVGNEVTIKPDYIVLNDSLDLELVNTLSEIKTLANKDQLIVILNYDIPAGSFTSAEIQKKLIHFAQEHHIEFVQAEGIGYHILLNKYVKEGDVVVSTGMHNSIFGSKGALGLHIESEQIIDVCVKGELTLTVPETVHVELKGSLSPASTMKDFMLTFLDESTKEKYAGKVIEFVGEGVQSLNNKQKVDLCLLAARSGAVSAFIQLNPQGIHTTDVYDLSTVKPAVALPGSIHQTQSVKALKDTPVAACFIGGCTGGSIEDLRQAAEILKDKKVATYTRLTISPETNEVYLKAMEEGLLETFIDSGAQIINPGCASCLTTSKGVVGRGENMLSASCWNFAGCNGTKDSNVFLASSATVAAAALTGYVCETTK